MKLTARRLEIMQGIARGGILFQSGWTFAYTNRWRDRGKRERRCSFFRRTALNSGHYIVSLGLAEKMEECGLIEKFKPHAGVPCYRLTAAAAQRRCCRDLVFMVSDYWRACVARRRMVGSRML